MAGCESGRRLTSAGSELPLRIALFSGNYNYTRDGANKALNRLVSYLLEEGAAVRVYSPTSKHPAFDPAGDLVSVPSISIPGRSEFRIALGLPEHIAADVRAFSPNIVHLSAPDWLGTGAQRLAKSLDVPTVASMHTRFETYFEYYGLETLRNWAIRRQRYFYRRCDRVFAPNESSRAQLCEWGVPDDRIDIWSRGVDHELFSPSRRDQGWRRELGYDDSDRIVLFFGRVVREKGTALFADTIEQLRSRGRTVRPLIIGDGPARREMAARLGDAVFLGHLEGEDLGRAVASADILLNPSVTEAFGNVNLEAMAAGLAIVSANDAAAASLITDGLNGHLCVPRAGDFTDVIENLMDDTSARDSLASQAVQTAKQYNWPEILASVKDVYHGQLASSVRL